MSVIATLRDARGVRGLAATALVAAAALAAPSIASAATITVNDDTAGGHPDPAATCAGPDFNSIQAAIDDAGTAGGDELLVCEGTYDEPAILVGKPLTVTGAGAGQSIIDGGDAVLGVPVNRAGQVNLVGAGDTTLSGFTIRNPVRRGSPGAEAYGVLVRNAAAPGATYTVTGNEIVGEDFVDNGMYVDEFDGDLVVSGNTVRNVARRGIGLEEAPGAVEVSGNDFQVTGGSGVVVFPVRVDLDRPYRITGNAMQGLGGVLVFSGDAFDPGESARITALEISGNDIAATVGAVSLRNSGTDASGASGEIAGATVRGNTLTGGGARGVQVAGLVTGAEVAGNTIGSFDDGVVVQPGTAVTAATAAHEPTGLDVEANRIAGNATGVQNDTGNPVDAVHNWWGCNEGPAAAGCDGVAGDVAFDPWLVLDIQAGSNMLAQGESTGVQASVDQDSGGAAAPADVKAAFPASPVAFGVVDGCGSVDPDEDTTDQGVAETVYTAPQSEGLCTVFAELDSERVETTISVAACDPPEEGLASGPIHTGVEPLLGGVHAELAHLVHDVNCGLVAPLGL